MTEQENIVDRVDRVWNSLHGGSDGWLKSFGYLQFAQAIIAEFVPQSDAAPIGRAHPLAGSEGGFTMCAWKASEVPVGTSLYTHPPVAVQEERDDFADTAMGLVDVYAESIRALDPTEHQIRERANIDHYLRRGTAPKTALGHFIDDVEEEDIRDAARYRYLVATRNCEFDPTDPWFQLVVLGPNLGDGLKAKLDTAIDAAMKEVNHG